MTTVAVSLPADIAAAVRVLVVDDSVVIRGTVARWLGEDPRLQVVGSAANGVIGLRMAEKLLPDVVILDIEMPEMDGLTALPLILAAAPGAQVLMSSTLTRKGAEVSFRAMSLGAADYLAKPSALREAGQTEAFRAELCAKVRALGATAQRRRLSRSEASPRFAATPRPPARPLVLRPPSRVRPQILAVGASTGGPQALAQFFGALRDRITLPILVTQHMPATFTAILAEHLTKASGIAAAEGQDGEPVRPHRLYVAPGGRHMLVEARGSERVIRLSDEPPENYCRPAVDPMFRTLAAAYGPAVLAVVLTGMGQDGTRGAGLIAEGGGTLLAQDEASSVVWGMPGALAQAGLASAVLPLGELAGAVERIISGGRP